MPMGSLRILLIDDDDRLRQAVGQVLSDEGHIVVEAREGAEAIRLYRAEPADLVMCDLFMPGKDGLETIRELRAEFPGVRIIALSGGAFQGTMDLLSVARHMGAAAVLSKPFKMPELFALIDRLIKA